MADARLKDRYVLERLPLAHNGMGEVWPARDALLDRPVIIKSVAATNADLVRRFHREALLTARLDHPGVPAIFDLGVEHGRPYLVLQRIQGITLEHLAAEQDPLPIAWIAAIGAQISSVLMAAHEIGLVHRDLKPSNVMLEPTGAVKVLDFGVAVIHDDERYSRITRTGESPGTVGYMAPEQILAEPTDQRTDLYGLGATLFHLLSGRAPFDGATTTTTLRHQLSDPPPRPSQLRPDTPKALDDLVYTLLAERPEDRPASAAHVYDALTPLIGQLPPMPGAVSDGVDAERCYAAVVGRQPAPSAVALTPRAVPRAASNHDDDAAEAEQLFADGQFRAAARRWRRLASWYAEHHGPDHPLVFDYHLRTARAHLALGEHNRALHLLDTLLQERTRVSGPDDPATLQLRQEIAEVRAATRGTPSADR